MARYASSSRRNGGPGDPNAEPGTIEDVKEGKVDMAWVGARVFDTLGVTSFQPLLAPLLVDSYDLERRVFESGLPEKMLSSVDELGVVGIGVLPGPMRKLVGVDHPFVRLADFEGQMVGGADNTLAERTFEALGATVAVSSGRWFPDGLDGLEQQLGSIWGNRYDNQADSVTSNLNLWPRPLVIVMGKQVFESLTPQQQTVLREAGVAAIPGALDASREEDEEAMGNLCRTNFPFVTSSTEEPRRASTCARAGLCRARERRGGEVGARRHQQPQIGDRDLRGGACLRARVRAVVRR